jgi:hypothetical protein
MHDFAAFCTMMVSKEHGHHYQMSRACWLNSPSPTYRNGQFDDISQIVDRGIGIA